MSYVKASETDKGAANVAKLTGGMGDKFTRKDGTEDQNFELTTSGFSFGTKKAGRMGVNVTLSADDLEAAIEDARANEKSTLKLTVFCDAVGRTAGDSSPSL